MSITLFSIMCCLFLIILFIKKQKMFKEYLGQNYKLYYCLAILFVSNLGLPTAIQYSCRLFGIVFSYLYIFLYLKNNNNFKKNKVAFIIAIYLLLCISSISYSISKIQTLFKCIEISADLFVIWLLYSKENNKEFAKKTITMIVYISSILLIITLIGFFVIPSVFANSGYSARKSILGIRLGTGLLGANKSSALAVICIVWLLLLGDMKSLYRKIMFIVSVLILFFSQSRSTLILVPIILLMKLYQPKNRYKYLLLIIVVIIVVALNYNNIYAYILRGQSESQLMSGTGRINVWTSAQAYINKSPLLGYGFGAGGELVAKNMYGLATMHSGIYETLLGTGFIGLGVLLLQYLYAFFKVFGRVIKYGIKNNLADIIIVIYFLIRSITSVGIGGWHSQELIIWFCFLFVISQKNSMQFYFSDKLSVGDKNEQ